MQIDFKINSVHAVLGDPVDEPALAAAGFRKAGPIRRLIKHLPHHLDVYSAENCHLHCFAEAFSIYPCTHRYLNRDRRWETSALLFLDSGRLVKVEFKVIDGQYAAGNFLDRFQETCRAALGEPVETTRYQTKWVNDRAQVTTMLRADKTNADFRLEIIPDS
jgi:hypothetical protein